MDKIKTVKIKNPDGSVSEETYTISVDAKDVDMANGKELQETIGIIDIDTDGNIAKQLENLNNSVDNLNIDIKKKAYFFDTVADMKNANLKIGDYVCTLGYYEVNDGGAADYKIITGNYLDNGGTYHRLNNGLFAELIVKNKINIKQFGAKAENNFDNADIIQNVINIAKNKYIVEIPAGVFEITKGLELDSGAIIIKGNGISNSSIKLVSNTATVLLNLKGNSSASKFENLYFNGVNRLHTGVRIAGNKQNGTTYIGANWKNSFTDCYFRNFNVAVLFTSDRNVLDGAQVDFGSENIFLHCKLKNNKTHIIQENKQSLNNKFEQTDLENEINIDDIDCPMIINRSGGGMIFDTCSIMGGGVIYYYEYPTGASTIMDSHYTIFTNCKYEIYESNCGDFIKQGDTNLNAYQNNFLTIENSVIYFHNFDDDYVYNLLNYYGRTRFLINNLNVYPNKTMTIYNQIVPGSSGNLFGDESWTKIINSNFKTKIVTNNGDERYISKIQTNNTKITANTSYYLDNGFRKLADQINTETFSENFQNIQEKEIAVVYPKVTYTFENQKFILPKNLYLTKLCLFKQGTRHVLNTTINLYMVKNIDKWEDSTSFNKETDATLIATITTGANKSGYFETNIVYSTYNGYDIRTGAIEDYSECRYYLEDTQPINKTAGIISIKYY